MINKTIARQFLLFGDFLQQSVLPDLLQKFRQYHLIFLYTETAIILAYRLAFLLDPSLAEANYKLGRLFQRQQKWQKAAKAFEKVKNSNYSEQADIYFRLGKVLLNLEKFDESVSSLRQAIELSPDNFLYYQHLGKALSEEGKISEAIKNNQIAIGKKISKIHPNIILNLHQKQHLLIPNFIIIGQVKCGTSSLYYYLTQHPQILPAIKKEIHFWNNNLDKGIDWYLSHFPAISSEQDLITGEATPNYLNSKDVALSLFQEFPHMKLIVLLRNPVDRAISQYYMFSKARIDKSSLEKSISSALEISTTQSNMNSYHNLSNRYIKRGQYIDHLCKWMGIFPKKQFLILKSEELFANPEATVNQVFQFLGVESYQLQEYRNHNEGKYPSVSRSVREALNYYFRPYNQKLEEYLERKFDWDC